MVRALDRDASLMWWLSLMVDFGQGYPPPPDWDWSPRKLLNFFMMQFDAVQSHTLILDTCGEWLYTKQHNWGRQEKGNRGQ